MAPRSPLATLQRRALADRRALSAVRCFALFCPEMRLVTSAAKPHAGAWQFGTGQATSGREKNCLRKAPRRFPTRSCWPSCCAPAPPDIRPSIWRAMYSRAFIHCASSSLPTGSDFTPSPDWDPLDMRNCKRRSRSREGKCRRPCAPALPYRARGRTRDFLTARLRDLEHEVFCCLYLDKRHRLDSIRRIVSRHHRRRQRASARDRQARATAQFRRRDHRA